MQGESRRKTVVSLAVSMVACALAIVVVANAEATTFGQDGIATPSLGVHFKETGFLSVEARPDGGVAARRTSAVPDPSEAGNQLEFFLANGVPDPGMPPEQLPNTGYVFPASGGKRLILDGSTLTRVNPDGSEDKSFSGGTVTLSAEEGSGAAELSSGKIIVIEGEVLRLHGASAAVVVQLVNPDGTVDRGVGNDGVLRVPVPVPGNFEELVNAIDPTGNGGALVSGSGFLLELRADGSPNPEFGHDGLITGLPTLVGARMLPDGSVEAVGRTLGESERRQGLAVLHYTAAGNPDSNFGRKGLRHFDFGGWEDVHAASWAADGSVIVGGRSETPCPSGEGCKTVPILVAFDPAGNLDSSFGQGGVARLSALAASLPGVYSDGVWALTRRPDGSIIAVGQAAPDGTVAFLAAVSPQGALLPSFGEGGIVRVRQPAPATQKFVDFVPLANGKLLAAGTTDIGAKERPVLARFDADGSIDRSFGDGAGYVAAGRSGSAVGFTSDGSGRVLMGVDTGGVRPTLLHLRAGDGKRVLGFGSNGAIVLPDLDRISGLSVAGDGGAIVLGRRHSTHLGVLLRYGPDGKPDGAFDRDGKLPLRLPDGEGVKGGALIASRRGILVGGTVGRRFGITRLLPDGRSDPRFGSGGWLLLGAGGVARSLTLSHAGSFTYLAGVAQASGSRHVVLMRFNDDGQQDMAFGNDGRLSAPDIDPAASPGGSTEFFAAASPREIAPVRDGVLVVLGGGRRPLLFFDRDGKTHRDWVGSRPEIVNNVRATVFRNHLILGWNGFSYPSDKVFSEYVFHLASRPLGSL